MTVIAFDGRYFAADRQVMWPGGAFGTVTKIYKLEGSHVAFAGNGQSAQELLKWFRSDRKPENYPKFTEDKDCSAYEVVNGKMRLYGDNGLYFELHDKHFSSGAGQDYAMAAMYLGKNAIESVRISSDLCKHCGQGVDWFDTSQN